MGEIQRDEVMLPVNALELFADLTGPPKRCAIFTGTSKSYAREVHLHAVDGDGRNLSEESKFVDKP